MDKGKFVELLMSIPQDKIKKDFLTAEMQNYIELQDFPVKGAKVKLGIWNFHNIKGTQTFRVQKFQDKYSVSFWTRAYQYNKNFDNALLNRKGDFFKGITPITSATIYTNFPIKRYANFQNVFVLEYFTVPVTSSSYQMKKDFEVILFQFKKGSGFSASVSSVTTP